MQIVCSVRGFRTGKTAWVSLSYRNSERAGVKPSSAASLGICPTASARCVVNKGALGMVTLVQRTGCEQRLKQSPIMLIRGSSSFVHSRCATCGHPDLLIKPKPVVECLADTQMRQCIPRYAEMELAGRVGRKRMTEREASSFSACSSGEGLTARPQGQSTGGRPSRQLIVWYYARSNRRVALLGAWHMHTIDCSALQKQTGLKCVRVRVAWARRFAVASVPCKGRCKC